jgi:hypothetical protein
LWTVPLVRYAVRPGVVERVLIQITDVSDMPKVC